MSSWDELFCWDFVWLIFGGLDFSYLIFLNLLDTHSHSLVPAKEVVGKGCSARGELDHIIFNSNELQLLQNHSVRAVVQEKALRRLTLASPSLSKLSSCKSNLMKEVLA